MLTPVENGIDLREISRSGSVLQIHHEDCEDIADYSDIITAEDTLGEPPQGSFDEIAKDMETVDEHGFVKKKMIEEGGGEILDENCIVGIAYSGYFEGEIKPFNLRPPVKPLDCNFTQEGTVLCGLRMAVLTMKVGELSMFLLSYKVMYGEMGNPPRIKPKADCLFYVKVIRSKLTPDVFDLIDEERNFNFFLKECKLLYKRGSTFYKTSNIQMAIRCFNKAANIMQRTRLADEKEEKVQEDFLLKLYYNLAICYNHMKKPRRACCMCNEIHRLQNIWNNGKAIYQNGKALRMIGDFEGAEKRLKRALKLCPDMKNVIEEELKILNNQMLAYEKSKLSAFKILEKEESSEQVLESFKTEVETLIKQFMSDPDMCELTLPKTLNANELKYVEDVAKRYKIFCKANKNDFALDKNSSSSNSTEDIFDD